MSSIAWGLVTCPEHQHQGAVIDGDQATISGLRGGCTACRITLTCPRCDWTTRHVIWSSATASEAAHHLNCDPTRRPLW